MSQETANRWKLDYEIEQATDGRITASRLRKDRIKNQIFPFHRVGRNCFYDLAEIDAAIEASRFGGNIGRPTRKQVA
jgi:hypothetical protein